MVDAPVLDSEAPKVDAPTGEGHTDTAAVLDAPVVAEKVVEPITEGQLAYKGPGLVKWVLSNLHHIPDTP